MTLLTKKNARWIACLHESIDQLHDDLKASLIKSAGTQCAHDLLGLCEEYLGKKINTVEDLIKGWNYLRSKRGLKGSWNIDGTSVRGVFRECGCPLVRAGMIELHPVQCYCSKAMIEKIFSLIVGKSTHVTMKKSIGRGDDRCEFIVTFN